MDGRWYSKPRSVIYAAERPALAMLEILTHLQLSQNAMPLTLRLRAVNIKNGVKIAPAPELPSGWQVNQPSTQGLGNTWLQSAKELLMKIPSAVLPESSNHLINPHHPQAAAHLLETDLGPFWMDARLARRQTSQTTFRVFMTTLIRMVRP